MPSNVRKNLRQRIDDACERYDIRSVIPFKGDKDVVLCPLPMHTHRNYTPSFSVFYGHKHGRTKQYWRCQGQCNRAGDIIDLIGYLYVSGYNRSVPGDVVRALQILEGRYPESEYHVPPPEKVKRMGLSGSEWKSFLPARTEVLEYAAKRGLTARTLEKFNVGQHRDEHGTIWMTIPAFEHGTLTGIKLRRVTPGGSLRYRALTGSRQGLFNYDAVEYTTKPVLVLKGEIPVMLLDQLGYLACAPTGGEGGWREDWRTALALADKVLIGDSDAPGQALGHKRAALLGGILRFPPGPYKDVDEWVLAEPDSALSTINGWIAESRRW
jgi:hypothetical protein